MIGRRLHVCSTKYDGSPHWEFDSWFVAESGPLIVTQEFSGQTYQTWKGPHIEPYDVRNHFWTNRWFNVMRCDHPRGGGLDLWYCNVATPAQYDGENVRYVDLDLDVVVRADGATEVLDEDEFVTNSRSMAYPPEVIDQARSAVDEILSLARKRAFPFDQP